MSESVYDKLAQLDITLDPVAAPGALFDMAVQTGKILFVSGHIARRHGAPWAGKLGLDVGTVEGSAAARAVAIDLLGTLHATLGNLNRVARIVKVMSLVNSAPDYTEQHIVTNGASELLLQVFGERGRHARSAFGVAQLPMGACVEIEIVVEVADAA
ncbi:L-PSP family endoribonuclease [Burkholderiaceae bacterium 16]|nr:L-PSP family endoribonuclease [Burkholderiaceae bacterium 16]